MAGDFYQQYMHLIKPKVPLFTKMINSLIQTVGKYKAMELIHSQVQEAVNVQITPNVSCSAGCSFCCHDIIYGSKMEMAYIRERIELEGIKPNQKLKEIQNSKPISELKWAEKRCSLLDDKGMCTIYEFRPLVCRLHNSANDPKFCDRSENEQQHSQAHVIDLEALQFAMLIQDNVTNKSDLTPLHKII